MTKRLLAILLILSLLAGIPVLNAVAADEDDVLRMIVIGNSYGYDSTQLLWKVYQTQNPDKKVQIGAMYYSGCSIEQHLNHIGQGSAVYDYKRTDENGTWVTTNDVTLETGLLDQQWDIVILMQGSGRGGADPYYFRNGQIQKLQQYVLSKLEVKPQFYWNLTWVSPQDTYFQDPDYMTQPPEGWADTLLDRSNGDSLGLFRRFAEGARTYIASDPTFGKVITPGTAIHYANNVLTDRDLYRDYTHLSDYGRVIAAHTIYCQIEGLTTLGSINMDKVEKSLRHSKFQKYGDLTITAEQKQIALEAVNHALKNPYEVPDTPVTAERCMNCTTEPVWTAWDGSTLAATDGHYYLTGDVTLSKTNVLTAGDYTISINLNGHTLTSNSRAFEVEEGATLSIMDSEGTGKVSAKGISGQNGAVVSVHSGGTFALQSGTLTMPSSNNGGSVVYVENGDMKVHGGKITDEKSATTEDVCMTGSSTLYARDGEISSLLTEGQVTVSRYAKIDTLTPGAGAVLSELVMIDHFYIGSVGLNLSVTAEAGLDLGGGEEKATLNGECFYLIGNDSYGAVLQDSQLVLKEKSYCQHCKKMATWHAITESDRSEMVQRSGHFYLGFDAASYAITERILFSGTEACLDLNGKTYNGIIRAFAVDNGATLNVMGTGKITGRGSYGDLPGGTIYVLEGGTLNLYGGTLGSQLGVAAKRTTDKGGVLAVDGTFNMYGGKVDPTSSYTPEWWPAVGGAVYVGPKGSMNMSGGQILSGQVTDTAPGVYVDQGGQVSLTGDSDIAELYFAESSADSLTVIDSYTGTVSLRYPSGVSLDDMADVGNSRNAEVAHAFISFTDAQCKTVAVNGTDLVVSEFPYTYGTCEVCGECWWTPMTDADFDAFGSYNMAPGHYRLTEDVTTTQKSLNKNADHPGTFCVDLAGHTFSGSTRGFLVYEGATLNIMDSVGGGVVEGCGSAAVAGGSLYVTKNSVINFYGGTVRSNPVNSETRSAGGAVTVNGGTFNLHGGTVEGSAVTGNGGAIQVKSDYDVPGTFTATGGQVVAGTAAKNGNCVYVDQGGYVVLSGDAKMDEIFFYESSADLLTVSGSYSGTVALKYPETVELTDLTDIGNSMDGDVSHASITFTDVPDKTAAVKDSDLVVSDSSYAYGYCEACGLCQWIPVTDADMDAFGKYDMLPGHYILTEDVTTLQKQPNYNADHPGTYCIDLAGHAFNGESRAFVVRSDVKLNIMDSVGGGTVTGHVSSAAGGGVIYVSNGEVNLYGGTVQHIGTMSDVILAGGAVRVAGGTFHLHDGTIVGYPVSTYGGAVYVSTSSAAVGTFIASGGQVIGAAAQTAGDCVYIAKNSNVVLSGDAVIDDISFAALSSDNLTVEGNYTGTAVLRYPDTAELTDLTDIGNSTSGDVTNASITLYNADGKTAAVKGTDLVISDLPYTYGTCAACGDCQWLPITNAELDAFGSEGMQAGHYILTEDVTTAQKNLNYNVENPGTYCLDLAGHTFTGKTRAFLIVGDARLNIFDTVGGGAVQGQSTEAVWGGALYIGTGAQIHLYGGTVRHDTTKSETVTTGGSVCVRGGDFYLHGGTVEGAKVTGRGAAIMVAEYEGVCGSFTATGGTVTMGTAEVGGPCVYATAGCKVSLSGDAGIAELLFVSSSADDLTVDGGYTGSVVLRYASSVSLADGMKIGTVSPQGDLSGASITVDKYPCKQAEVNGDALVIRDSHNYQSQITAPSCTEAGFTTHTCSVCGNSYTDGEVAALGHSYETVTVDATCTEDGSITDTCATCGDTKVQVIPATGHSHEAVVTAPTCTETGYTTYTCACGDSYVSDEVAAAGHRYETVTVNATCTEDGSITDTCAVCGDTQIQTIPATGHNYEAVVTEPTCTEDGYTTYTCACGDSYAADAVSAVGHSYSGGVCTACDACEHCGDCQWVLITEADLENLQPGHYRLSESIEVSQQQLTIAGTYCIDLAGYTFTGASRAFYLGTGATLDIMDSIGGGVVEGKSGASVTGGVIYIYSSATLNLYGGTLRHNTQNSETVTTGGVVCVSGGTFNMYNGTVEGANVTGYGGAIMISSRNGLAGTVTVSGGEITKGTAGGSGECVYVNTGCKIVLTGNAMVEDIRFTGVSSGALEIVGIYTGTTALRYPASALPTDGTDIGNGENADISAAVITVANAPCMKVGVSGTDLVVTATHSHEAVVTAPTCTEKGYTTYTCACGDTYIADEVAALGHSYEIGTVNATCTEDGSTTYTCATCGDTKVEVIPATGHSFENGTCGTCGEADPDYVAPVVQPTLTLKAPTLEFKDMICVVAFYTAENIDDVVEMGMITYKEKVDEWNVETADYVIPGANYDEGSGRYYSSSQGIHAKYLADTVYLACYAKLSDGSYVYTKLAPYSPITYATNQLKNSTNTQLKQLVAAMLNYGAEAQLYFGHNVDALANASMTEEQQALPESYREDMVQAVPAASAEKQGTFANNKGFSVRKPAISFEGAFCINYFFTPAYAPVDGITLYYWNETDYNANSVLTTANATGKFKLEGSGTGEYRGDIEGIAAKSISEAIYVAAAYKDSNGTVWTSGVLGYSIGAYCSSQAAKGGDVAALAMATAVYGYHAKQYFG